MSNKKKGISVYLNENQFDALAYIKRKHMNSGEIVSMSGLIYHELFKLLEKHSNDPIVMKLLAGECE